MPRILHFWGEFQSTVHWQASLLRSISPAKDTGLCLKPFNVLNTYLHHQPHRMIQEGRRGWQQMIEQRASRYALQASLSNVELAACWGHKCSFNISFSKAAKVALSSGPLLASSISVLLAKGRSQCVMSMMWRKKWEISGTNTSPPCFDWVGHRVSRSSGCMIPIVILKTFVALRPRAIVCTRWKIQHEFMFLFNTALTTYYFSCSPWMALPTCLVVSFLRACVSSVPTDEQQRPNGRFPIVSVVPSPLTLFR